METFILNKSKILIKIWKHHLLTVSCPHTIKSQDKFIKRKIIVKFDTTCKILKTFGQIRVAKKNHTQHSMLIFIHSFDMGM